MSLSDSIAAYGDCYELYERARSSNKGIRILLPNYNQAFRLRNRMNQARCLERREAKQLYERHDPRFGKSENDKFRVTIIEAAEGDGSWWLYVDEWSTETLAIEEIE